MLGRAVDQSLSRQGDHLGRDRRKLVDRDDAFDLGKQTLDQTKVAAGDASDRIDDGGIGVLVERHVQAKLHPLVLDNPLQFQAAQGSELVDEADSRVQLRVAGESFLQTRHANEHDANISTIVEVAELFKACGFETVGFINHEQVWRLAPHRCVWIAVPRGAGTQAVDCPHRLPTATSTVRGVLVTPGVYSTVRHGPLSRGGVGVWR